MNRLERRLQTLRAPDEPDAEERAWAVVRSVYGDQQRSPARRGRRIRIAVAPAILTAAALVALSPAGAAVHRWLDRALGVRHASASLFSLPAPGRVLVSGPGGAWTIAANGSRRHLGPWAEASWSPRGIYVGVAARNELAAVDVHGALRWSIARPEVRFPRWFAPTGYRVAYLSGTALRVIAGDGTGDRLLASHVAVVAPAWRPDHAHELAYATAAGALVVRDADTGAIRWTRRLTASPRLLAWSADGAQLLVLAGPAALVLDGGGQPAVRFSVSAAAHDAAVSPDGRTLATLTDGDVTLSSIRNPGRPSRRVFSGSGLRQLAWSSNGQWLLVSWPAADQWIFIHATGHPRIMATSRIAEQLGAAGRGFPQLDGWCCAPLG